MDQLNEVALLRARVAELEAALERPESLRDELRERNAWLEVALESARMGIWSWDVATGEVRWSDEVCGIFGIEPGGFGGTLEAFRELVHPEDRDAVERRIAETMSSDESWYTVEHRLVHPELGVRWVSGQGRVQRSAAGEALGITGTVVDITEAKRAEAALQERDLQLRQAQRLESVGRLAGGVAHDFNNLLTVISGCIDLAEANPELDLAVWTQRIREAADRGASLTRQLLAFARRQVVRPQVLDLNQQVDGLLKMLGVLLGEDVRVEPALEASGAVEIDPGQLEQVVLNLAVNARDAMPEGGVLTIASADHTLAEEDAARGLPGGAWVELTVTDTGVGIGKETLPFVFEPFFTTKAPGQGTGLGLATCFGIVRQAGGRMRVESELGEGTRVSVFLPRVSDAPAAPSEQPPKGLSEGKGTVLLVEDDEQVRRVGRMILQHVGYRPLEAANAAEALELFQAHRGEVCLVVTDVVMPGRRGTELARELIALEPELRVLFVSGYVIDPEDLQLGSSDRIDLLQKPFTASQLAEAVKKILSSRPGTG